MKYLVMESANSYAVLLDEDGRFVKSANLGYEVGDTVINPVLMLDTPLEKVNGQSKVRNRVIATVIAIAAMVMFVFGVHYYQQSLTPYSSIFMAINPEVEIVLNKSGDVMKVNGINADGRTLIEKYNLESKDKSVIANDMVNRAIEMGYLTDGGRVAIAIDTPDQALFEQYGTELHHALGGRDNITISITDMDNRDQGQEETPEPEIEPEPQPEPEIEPEPDVIATPEEDSNYGVGSYEEPVIPEPSTPAPSVPKTPDPPVSSTPAPPAQEERPAVPPVKPTPAPEKPARPGSSKPSVDNSDDTDYDDSDYDDTDYDDSDYDSDYDESDYYDNRRPGKGNRNENSHKDNDRNENGHSTGRNSRNRD